MSKKSGHRSRSRSPLSGIATTIKTIGGVTITLSKNLESLTEDQLVAAATMAISRLGGEAGPTGLVIITSFSHTAIIADIQGTPLDKEKQKTAMIEDVSLGKRLQVDPESIGLSLTKPSCFALPDDMCLEKLNIAGPGAKSFVSPEYISLITQIVTTAVNPRNVIETIKATLQPQFITQAEQLKKEFSDSRIDNIKKQIAAEIKKAAKRDPAVVSYQHLSNAAKDRVSKQTPYIGIVETTAFDFHHGNLHSGAAFNHFTQQPGSSGSCMMNKQYLRYNDNPKEHLPGEDWNINAYDKNGKQLIGNIGNMPDTYDDSWRMDLITIVKILKKTDKVTTKDILDLLYENEIRNVVFIDGGCNVFCGDGGMLACSGCHPALDIICDTCQIPIRSHPWGGMKNKKIKKTTKKKATVRGRRMRKSYKRYKRSKNYKQ